MDEAGKLLVPLDTVSGLLEEFELEQLHFHHEKPSYNKDKWHLPYRYVMAMLMFFAYFNCMATRVNFNIALVAMVNHSSLQQNSSSGACPVDQMVGKSNPQQTHGDIYEWSAGVQSLLLGAFYYGYILTQFPGGYMAERLGTKIVITVSMTGTVLFTLLTPVAASLHPVALFITRFLLGMFQGPLFPANYVLWSRWAPRRELTSLLAFSVAGAYLGTVLSDSLSGMLAETGFLDGYPSCFYIFGLIAMLWTIIWVLCGYDSPEKYPKIREEELELITRHKTRRSGKPSTPSWRLMFTSKATWAILIAMTCDGIGFFTLFSCIPQFMEQVLHYTLADNGLLSSLPIVAMGIVTISSGLTVDLVHSRTSLSTGVIRKSASALGAGGCALVLIGVSQVTCDRTAAVALLTLAGGLEGLNNCGYIVNALDIAPAYAGIIAGLAQALTGAGGFIAPEIMNAITGDTNSRSQWHAVFYVNAGVFFFGMLTFILLGSGEVQPWAQTVDVTCNGDEQLSSEQESVLHVNNLIETMQSHKYADQANQSEHETSEILWMIEQQMR